MDTASFCGLSFFPRGAAYGNVWEAGFFHELTCSYKSFRNFVTKCVLPITAFSTDNLKSYIKITIMKHFFTSLALACICGAQAWAVDVVPVTPERFEVSPVVTPRQTVNPAAANAKLKASSLKALSLSEIAGDYYVECDYLAGDGSQKYDITVKVADEAKRQVSINGLPLDCPIYGTINEDGTRIEIPNRQFLRMVGNDSIFFYFKNFSSNSLNLEDGVSSIPSATGYVTSKAIAFDVDNIWAIGDPNTEKLGYYFLAYNMMLMKYIADWKPIGKATFQDGWVLPGFGLDQTDRANWYEVEMEQDKNRPTRYRLVNPYHGECPVLDKNQDTRGGYIQFDIKDPEHVVFDLVSAGFSCPSIGISDMICYNYLTMFSLNVDDPIETIVKTFGNTIPYTKYKDGVLTLQATYSAQFNEIMEDACFCTSSNVGSIMGWNTSMYTRIFFPGTKLPDPNEGWRDYGTATFQDGWLLPVYGIDQTKPENWYEVPVQVKEDNPNIYRLVDPYHSKDCPIAQYNKSEKVGYIQFDVTDPDHVRFDIVSCGMAEPALNMTTMYLYNTLTSYMHNMGLSAEEVVDVLGESLPYTTFKDGVVSATGYITDPQNGIQYDCCVGSQLNIYASQRWKVIGGEMANMSTVITLPPLASIDAVGSDANADAPVEYFNLQGMRVAQPAAGQVVIRRQGTEVSKILVR